MRGEHNFEQNAHYNGQWSGPDHWQGVRAERAFPPEVTRQLVERQAQTSGDLTLRRHYSDPEFARMVEQGRGNVIEQGEQVNASLHDVAFNASGYNQPKEFHDAAYALHDRPTLHMMQGRLPPEEVHALLEKLRQQGYPLDELGLLGDVKRTRGVHSEGLAANFLPHLQQARTAGTGLSVEGLSQWEELVRLMGRDQAREAVRQAEELHRLGGI